MEKAADGFENLNGRKGLIVLVLCNPKKSIKEIHLAQGTKTVIFVAWRQELGILKHLILLICVGFFALQIDKVSGLRSIDLVLRWDKELLPFVPTSRTLKAVVLKDLQTNPGFAPAPSMALDPNQSNKRRVRRGSDPIHNRC
ncbi:hypothetical protein LWI28_016684 [Acer negundo]|uniref:Uncharacterized protein n=1 Tax=Acer negundo TaxID=4023 RepID=A0AAD5NQ99_ACENE|nr:hypothetical protein LWI28_016684 [Acer negundo]KAK4843139.1 hypothetical protein QYF36_004483 [Acer negundo]